MVLKRRWILEQKLAGKKKYGSRSNKVGDVIATNEPLRALNVQRDNKKLQIIEMQNNAKENIRVRYGVPRDLLDGSMVIVQEALMKISSLLKQDLLLPM